MSFPAVNGPSVPGFDRIATVGMSDAKCLKTSEERVYKLTENRLSKCKPFLEEAREKLLRTGAFSVAELEGKLRQAWGIGNVEMKQLIGDVFKKHERYRLVAVYFMEHSDFPGPPNEYKSELALAYGIKAYQVPELNEARRKFWDKSLPLGVTYADD